MARCRLVLGLVFAFSLSLVAPSSSLASITIGSALQTEPSGLTSCATTGIDRGCMAVDDVVPGSTIVAPATGVLTAWHVRLGNDTKAQTIRIRVVRHAMPDTFTVLTSGPLESVPAGAGTYTFPLQLPVNSGDQIAMDAGSGVDIEWRAPLPGAVSSEYSPGTLDGGTTGAPTFTNPGQEHTFNALLDPTNTFTLGAVTRNNKKGTATVQATVPNPGELTGSGNGAKVASAPGAGKSVAVGAPGTATLTIKAKGKKKRKLNEKGKVNVKVAITYTPTGGDPRTESLKVKLKKKR